MSRWIKKTALLWAAALLTAGCSMAPGPAHEPAPIAIAGAKTEMSIYIVDEAPQVEVLLVQEFPPITAEPLASGLAGGSGMIAPVSLDRRDVIYAPSAGTSSRAAQTTTTVQKPKEVKSVWISYLELDGLLKGKTAAQFTQGISGVFDNVKDFGLNTVVVQVRPFADAIYPSDYFPWSYLATGTEGVDPGFDPLAIMVEQAHARGLRIEAWVNPYRVRNANSGIGLSAGNKALQWLNASNGSAAKSASGLIVFNPASVRAQELIVNGVREIVRKYAVDGVHIDDYFYPDTGTSFDKTFDSASYTAYKNGGGTLSLENWRRANVTALIQKMYAAVKEENPKVLFGISPQSSVTNNYNTLYLDIEKILSSAGYCDYVCPQIYFGYQNDVQPFEKTLKLWNDMIKVDSIDLYVGVAAYKTGRVDSWAGSGKGEWQQNQDILSRQLTSSRAMSHYSGVVLYRYDSIFNPESSIKGHVDAECGNLQKIL